MGEQLTLRGELVGHNGWVTCLATSAEEPDQLVSGGRDNSLLVWHLTRTENYGFAARSLVGHAHIVHDIAISTDAQFVMSASADATLRLWNIQTGQTERRFVSHTKDVLSVAFSSDNRQICSAGRDGTIKLWNTLGECKYTITQGGHNGWVSCVRFSPSTTAPMLVSCGWDRTVKLWTLTNCSLRATLTGHKFYLNCVTVSPDGSLAASAGRGGMCILWDLYDAKQLYELQADGDVHALVFSPNRYWLCAATSTSIQIFDLESKQVIDEIKADPPAGKRGTQVHALSLAWSADGSTLFAGFTDSKIRVYAIASSGL